MIQVFLDGMYKVYCPIKPSPVQSRVATILAQQAAKVLKVPLPPIKFFLRKAGEQNFHGFATDEGIFIGSGQTDLDVCRTVIHEMRHHYHRYHPGWMRRSEEHRERDALLFELEWPR